MDTHPENTIPSFQEAIQAGAHMIELDVQLSADGAVVLMHDATVDRTTDGHGAVANLTLAQLQKLDAGAKKHARFAGTRIPTFAQALEVMPRNVWLNCHLKGPPPIGAAAVKVLQQARRERQAFLAATPPQAKAAQAVTPDITICNMSRGPDPATYVRETIALKTRFIQLQSKSGVTPELVAPLLAAGITINSFYAATEAEIRAWLAMGVNFPLVNNIKAFMPVARDLGIAPVTPVF